MAKAKKSESESSPAPKKAPAKKAPAKKPVGGGSPLIDTSLAAENAARMLVAGRNRPAGNSNAPMQESAMFKQLKAGLNKPHATAMSNLLDKSHGPEPARNHPSMKQVGHDQTYGADVTRSGVPRRTPG
jgi:hypothetical protein